MAMLPAHRCSTIASPHQHQHHHQHPFTTRWPCCPHIIALEHVRESATIMLVLRQHLVRPAADAPLPPPLLRLRCLRRLRCRRPRRAVHQYRLGRTATATAAAAWRGDAASVVHDMIHVVARRAHHEHQGEVQNAPRGDPHCPVLVYGLAVTNFGFHLVEVEKDAVCALLTGRPALPLGYTTAKLATSIPKPGPRSMHTRERNTR